MTDTNDPQHQGRPAGRGDAASHPSTPVAPKRIATSPVRPPELVRAGGPGDRGAEREAIPDGLSTERLARVVGRIVSGFYDTPGVLAEVATRVSRAVRGPLES